MSIPLDRLYNYLDDLNNCDILIYRFSPHGSKNLNDLQKLQTYSNLTQLKNELTPIMVCHDQEPLDFDSYQNVNVNDIHVSDVIRNHIPGFPDHPGFRNFVMSIPRIRLGLGDVFNFNDKILLCHSEKNSTELEKFSNDCIGVYYWSHAIIARDWFRYATHDPILSKLNNPLSYNYDFLIYNRAWSGTREYRLKFTELLLHNNLQSNCLTSFSPVDGIPYTSHKFKNPALSITSENFEQHLPQNTYTPCASADYNNKDYIQSGIEVVLETLFDDQRHHLTEKVLRPIACGKPFILAATPGSLKYLRDYGFETYDSLIDESYDNIVDPIERLHMIINEMHRIRSLPREQKIILWDNLNKIAKRNQTLFFSDEWQQTIIYEYISNRDRALKECRNYRKATWRIEAGEISISIGGNRPRLSDDIMKILSGQDPV